MFFVRDFLFQVWLRDFSSQKNNVYPTFILTGSFRNVNFIKSAKNFKYCISLALIKIILVKLKLFLKILLCSINTRTLVYGVAIFLFSGLSLKAQKDAITLQDLSFGTFYTGASGGTVTMSSSGVRSSGGSVVLFTSDEGNKAIIQVTVYVDKLLTYTIGNIVNLNDGSGNTMVLAIDDFYPSSPFTPTDKIIEVWVGGTLTVGTPASTPAGNYSGSFEITFNAQ